MHEMIETVEVDLAHVEILLRTGRAKFEQDDDELFLMFIVESMRDPLQQFSDEQV